MPGWMVLRLTKMEDSGGLGDEPESGPAGCKVPLGCFVGFAQLAGREQSKMEA